MQRLGCLHYANTVPAGFNTEVNQRFMVEVGQEFEIDVVLGERSGVVAKIKLVQPSRYAVGHQQKMAEDKTTVSLDLHTTIRCRPRTCNRCT